MNKFDAVVVIDGPYKGWVGYLQDREDEYAEVKLFDNDGNVTDIELPLEYIKIVEPV